MFNGKSPVHFESDKRDPLKIVFVQLPFFKDKSYSDLYDYASKASKLIGGSSDFKSEENVPEVVSKDELLNK